MMDEQPKISVVMSVFNTEDYLRDAVQSILDQTFRNFEFIIIDDGSTDKSRGIIEKFTDPRIRLLTQENIGLVASLNRGINEARGTYIARMDADDISEPERFREQVDFLDAHPKCAVLATRITMIDQIGVILDDWSEDSAYTTDREISGYLPTSNCLAHPSVLARAEVMRSHPYRQVAASEDYELWMRLVADGYRVSKLPKKLLRYRIHGASITQTANAVSSTRKLWRAKKAFLAGRIRALRFGYFEIRVAQSMLAALSLALRQRARKVLGILAAQVERPFLRARTVGAGKQPSVLFLVNWLTIGGADKVILDIITGMPQVESHIITTEKSENAWESNFSKVGALITHLPQCVRFRRNYPRYIADYVRRNNISRVVISNSPIGYEATPFIKKNASATEIIDILHGQGGRIDSGSAPKFSNPFRSYLDRRVTVTDYLRHYMERVYNIPAKQFVAIGNGIDLDDLDNVEGGHYRKRFAKSPEDFVISWVGRLSDEKKPLLALDVARQVLEHHPEAILLMAGDGLQRSLAEEFIAAHNLGTRVKLLGSITDPLNLILDSDVVLMTSEMEGYPLVLVEAQALGVPVVASRVGGIPEIVEDGSTGVLVDYNEGVEGFCKALLSLLKDPAKLHKLGQNALKSRSKFDLRKMITAYKKVLKA